MDSCRAFIKEPSFVPRAILFVLSNPESVATEDRRRQLDALSRLNQERLSVTGDPEIATRIEQYELAFRMQASVPELMSIQDESEETLRDTSRSQEDFVCEELLAGTAIGRTRRAHGGTV